jgi:hypothetical protein
MQLFTDGLRGPTEIALRLELQNRVLEPAITKGKSTFSYVYVVEGKAVSHSLEANMFVIIKNASRDDNLTIQKSESLDWAKGPTR